MKVYLKVPFAEKDDAKKQGARWDAARKAWYIESTVDRAPFLKWSPTDPAGHDAGEPPQKTPTARVQSLTAEVVIGSEYVEPLRVCTCLPWDVCDKCESMALSR